MSKYDLSYDPVDLFFRKIFYQYLIYIPKGSGKSMGFLENMKDYGGNLYHPDFLHYIERKEKAHKKADKKDRDWVMVSHFIDAKEIAKLKEIIEKHHPEVLEDYDVSKNVHFLADLLDLNKSERRLLQFYRYTSDTNDMDQHYRYIFSSISSMLANLSDQYEVLFGIEQSVAKKILSKKTNLLSSGILTPSENYYFQNHFELNEKILQLVTADVLNDDVIEQVLFPSNLDTDLDLSDFHQEEEINILSNIVNSGLKKKAKGINALLWGLPGTGKTELSLILAKKNNWDLKVIGDISESEDSEKSRGERLFALKIAQKLFRNQKGRKIVLLFDEMEDLFKMDINATFSKAFINRIIEKTRIPIIWTTNDLTNIGSSAVLRRMTYAIKFEVPPVDARRKIWIKYADKHELELPEEILEDLSIDFDVVPALISNAVKVAKLGNVPTKDISKVLSNLDTAMNLGFERELGKRKKEKGQYKFEVELSNTDLDLELLVRKILESDHQNFSMCLYGPPGTGKSAFARYLAEQMKLKVSFKRASDLLSMWVGENEKNIAKMFKESATDKKFLVMDEADSFLESRQGDKRSWEVSKVNEMLTQMEFHPMPFVATTNLLETLDEASLRRFTFKIKFDFLRKDQFYGLFRFYFQSDPPSDLFNLEILTPGDFANVKKKADFLNITDPNEICNMLIEECKFKPQFKNLIGFTPPPEVALRKEITPTKDDDQIAAEKKE